MPWLRSLLGTALLVGACTSSTDMPSEPLILDFGKGQVTSWRALNDGVMGGRSIGVVEYDRKSMTWAGTVSLENNGGFSSVRSGWGERDLSAFDSMTLRCRTPRESPTPSRSRFPTTVMRPGRSPICVNSSRIPMAPVMIICRRATMVPRQP